MQATWSIWYLLVLVVLYSEIAPDPLILFGVFFTGIYGMKVIFERNRIVRLDNPSKFSRFEKEELGDSEL